ncbi:MAG: fumarylacetoacetate hydrolase family protein [Desulfobacteraceae bacterium]|nr:fumarylacetoacetate hydrolase family protein [Desulfobacteraceae bacterium]
MKLITFITDKNEQLIGALTKNLNNVVVLDQASQLMAGKRYPFFTDMISFLQGGEEARHKAAEILKYVEDKPLEQIVLPLDSVHLLAPVPRPESIRDCMAFEDHIINCIREVGFKKFRKFDEWLEKKFGRKRTLAFKLNKAWYERPIYYKSNRFSVVGPDSKIKIPKYSQKFDYELEWGIFIGKKGVDIPREKAHEYIGGYTVFNDFSARDRQMKEQAGRLGPSKGKDFDTGNAIGPYLITPDEISDPYNLIMTASVNGKERSRGNSSDMHWTFEEMISYISQSETLYPGEFIGSGTCSGSKGSGCGLELSRFLKSGDVVELMVENIGVLKNRIV